MPKYGLISETDANTIEKTLRLIFEQFPSKHEVIQVTEVGIYAGETGNGIREFIQENGRAAGMSGIDNGKDAEKLRFDYNHLYIGNSDEVAYKVKDDSQHLVFVDACHCFSHVISDFFSYANKVKKGGFLAFHDAGKHIKQFQDFQHGDKENPDSYISVRKALESIGMFKDVLHTLRPWVGGNGFELIFDEADETNEAGGICVFKKLY